MDWTFDGDRAIYTQLIELVERAVATGAYAPGQKLPPVRELAAEAGVNPNTMQRALAELENRGLLHTQRTSGRFVTEDAELIATLRGQLAGTLADQFVQGMQGLNCGPQETDGYVKAAWQRAAAPPKTETEEDTP